MVPFYYASLYSGLALALSLLTALVLAYVKRISPEQAALAMDSFGFDERIITAYECLGQESVLVRLQREDAMNQLAEHQDRIRLALLPSWKKPVLLLLKDNLQTASKTPNHRAEKNRELPFVEDLKRNTLRTS